LTRNYTSSPQLNGEREKTSRKKGGQKFRERIGRKGQRLAVDLGRKIAGLRKCKGKEDKIYQIAERYL